MTSSSKIVDEGPESRLRLTLRAADGSAWQCVVSRSAAKFIGRYPRMPEMRRAGAILRYAPVADGMPAVPAAPPWPTRDD